jgi:hypothetical protein
MSDGDEYDDDFEVQSRRGSSGSDLLESDTSISAPDGEEEGDGREDIIARTEKKMRYYEREAMYIEAEKARRQLLKLRERSDEKDKVSLKATQQEDIRIFFNMVAQHQQDFDEQWKRKALQHKVRADDLIEAMRWRHEQEQQKLYDTLKKKRMPKYSVQLLNLRKRQISLAKGQHYLEAEKMKQKADEVEAQELDRIRKNAKAENQSKFNALLKQQASDRQALASKLKNEKKMLLEMKTQDLNRLKKRLRNAEAELRKTHVRQQHLARSARGKDAVKYSKSRSARFGKTDAAAKTQPRSARKPSSSSTASNKPSARALVQGRS